MELNNSGGIVKTYIYANSQIIAQHTGDHTANRYFYLHDRLGSVRQVIDTTGNVKNRYIYKPFGELHSAPDFEETVDNPFKFTGQYFDSEIDQYYLRARQYDPHIARFTARDPVFGKFKESLTLHAYLYCLNNPVNYIDPSGCFGMNTRRLTAIYTRCLLFGMVLNSDLALSDMALGLAVITDETTNFLDPKDKANKIDYRTGPRAFRHLKVTLKDREEYGSWRSAEYMAKLRITTRGSAEAAKYYMVGYPLSAAGAVLEIVGAACIKAKLIAPGVAFCASGAFIGAGGILAIADAQTITKNADEAAELFGTWRGPKDDPSIFSFRE
jgi:RHS repeat-associated protein